RNADQRAQLHNRLIELPGSLARFGDEGCCERPDEALPVAGKALPVVPEKNPAKDPRDVRVYGGNRFLVGEARDSSRGVASYPRQLDQLFRILRQPGNALIGIASPGNALRQLMEV